MVVLFVTALVLGVLSWLGGRFARKALAEGHQFPAVVCEHRPPNFPILRYYPYVEYVDIYGQTQRKRLEMPSKDKPSVAIGEQIDVVDYHGRLYHVQRLTAQPQLLGWLALLALAWALLLMLKS